MEHPIKIWLVVWNIFFHILGIITPTDFHIFQKGLKPPEMDDLSRGIPDFGGEHP